MSRARLEELERLATGDCPLIACYAPCDPRTCSCPPHDCPACRARADRGVKATAELAAHVAAAGARTFRYAGRELHAGLELVNGPETAELPLRRRTDAELERLEALVLFDHNPGDPHGH